MVLDPPHLRFLRQQVFEMPAPPRRVLALAVFAGRSPIEYALNPPAHPACRLGLLGPDRLDRLHDQARVDRSNRQRTKDRVDAPTLPLPRRVRAPARERRPEIKDPWPADKVERWAI